jgi:cbb3-type cytochrome oxidase subunit 3
MEILESDIIWIGIAAWLILIAVFLIGYVIGAWTKRNKRLNDNNWRPNG